MQNIENRCLKQFQVETKGRELLGDLIEHSRKVLNGSYKTGYEDADWIRRAPHRVQDEDFVNTVTELLVTQKAEFLSTWMTASFTRLTLLYGVSEESFKLSEGITSDDSKTAC
jgi:hypothetical protein